MDTTQTTEQTTTEQTTTTPRETLADTTQDTALVARAISAHMQNASAEAGKLAARMFDVSGSGAHLIAGMLASVDAALAAHKGTVTERMVWTQAYVKVAREQLGAWEDARLDTDYTRQNSTEAGGEGAYTAADVAKHADHEARALDALRGTIALLNGVMPASVQTVNAQGKREQHEQHTAILRGTRAINGRVNRTAPAYVPDTLRPALAKAQAERMQREKERAERITRQAERKQIETAQDAEAARVAGQVAPDAATTTAS